MKLAFPLSVFHLCFICGSLFMPAGSPADDSAAEKLPTGLKVVSIEAKPAAIELKHKFDYRQLLISGKLQSGETVDLTRMAKVVEEAPAVTVSADGLVRAKADGAGKLKFSFEGKS